MKCTVDQDEEQIVISHAEWIFFMEKYLGEKKESQEIDHFGLLL